MKDDKIRIYEGRLADDEEPVALLDICQQFMIQENELLEWVYEGIVTPQRDEKEQYRFSILMVERIRKVHRLKRDFELNTTGVALVMDLLDRIESLEKEMKRYNFPQR